MKRSVASKQFVGTLLCLLFATKLVLADYAESTLWRVRQGSEKVDGAKRPFLPAGLPSLRPRPASVQGLPSVNSILGDDSTGNTGNYLYDKYVSLLSMYGSVRGVSVPGRVRGRPVVIHIQDVHQNPEAQAAISGAIRTLTREAGIDLIALEGAFAPIGLKRFHTFSAQAIIRKAANYLLKENQISGPLHAALMGTNIPAVVGVDDFPRYQANVEAYK